MATEQTSEEKTVRYQAVLDTIRAGVVAPEMQELQWFAETSMEFASGVGTIFSEARVIVNATNMLLTAIAEHTEPSTMHPDVVAAVMALGVLLGHMTPEDIIDNEAQEVLQ